MTFGWETAAACILGAVWLGLLGARGPRARREGLLAAISAVLLWVWQPLGLVITVGLTGLTWLGLRYGRQDSLPRLPPALVITLLVATLVTFKHLPGVSGALVPLGLSFTVFRLIGIVLDVNALRQAISLSRLFALSLFFPTLPAGPITSVRSFQPIAAEEAVGKAWRQGCWRIVLGLFRKTVMADPLYALVIGPWLGVGVTNLEPYQCLVLPVFLGLYVYWDFAGYSDVAIGMARLLGYQVPENFNRPYASRSLIEFWRRWHITLSEWIRNRLMMKLTGRRPTVWRLHGATLVSMALCGIWHGAGVGFLIWGIWHGLGLVCVHLFEDAGRRHPSLRTFSGRVLGDTVATALTFAFVTIGWTFFFLPPAGAWALAGRIVAWRGDSQAALGTPALVLGALLLVHFGADFVRAEWQRLPPFVHLAGRTIVVAVSSYVLFLTGGARQGFFYAQF